MSAALRLRDVVKHVEIVSESVAGVGVGGDTSCSGALTKLPHGHPCAPVRDGSWWANVHNCVTLVQCAQAVHKVVGVEEATQRVARKMVWRNAHALCANATGRNGSQTAVPLVVRMALLRTVELS